MKQILLAVIFFFALVGSASAEYWCQWSGSAGINCMNSAGSQVTLPNGARVTVEEGIMNSYGYYKVTTTEPSIGTDEKRGSIVWDKVDNQISRTWSVDSMTQTEIDTRDCADMQNIIWLAKKLVAKGTLTIGDFTAAEQTIYQACDAID